MTKHPRRPLARRLTVLAASAVLVAAVVVPSSAAVADAGTTELTVSVTYGGAPYTGGGTLSLYRDYSELHAVEIPPSGQTTVQIPAGSYSIWGDSSWPYPDPNANGVGYHFQVFAEGSQRFSFEIAPSVAMVSGTVTRGGETARTGAVEFTSPSGDYFRSGAISLSGRYEIALPVGEYQVTVGSFHNDGFRSMYARRSAGAVTVSSAGSPVVKDIALAAFSRVTGLVESVDGDPVTEVLAESDVGGFTGSGGVDYQDADGRFHLLAIDVGSTATISVNRQSGQSLYTGRYYAGANKLGSAKKAAATTVTVSGAVTDLGVVKLDTCGTVRGRVANPPAGVEMAVVVFNDADADLVTRSAPVAADGSFAVTGLLPGSYYAALNAGWDAGEGHWVETFFNGVSPGSGAPNVVVPASCGDVNGVDFGVAPEPPDASGVVPVMPVRLADLSSVVGFGSSQCRSVSDVGAPAGAQGVLVNVASVDPPTEGNALVFPSDGSANPKAPEGASVTFEPGQTVASAAFAKVGDDGKVCVYSQSGGASRVVLDVSGFSMPDSGVTLQASRRLLDTRTEASGLAARKVREVQVGGKVGVPADAQAVVVTVTAVMPQGVGHLRLFPATGAQTAPDVATLHYAPGKTKSNAAIVPLGNGGKIGLYSDTDTPVQVVVDVTGYVTAGSSAYHSIDPARVLDTRASAPAAVRKVTTLKARQPVAFDVKGTGLVPGATAVVLNVTAISPNSVGNLRVYPDDAGNGATSPPNASNINYIAGRNIPNMVMVKVPTDGKIMLYSDQPDWGTVDVAFDLVGYVTGK